LVRKCTKCEETKPLSSFSKQAANKDGRKTQCKVCCRTKALQTQSKNPEFIREKNLKTRFNLSIDGYNHQFLHQRGLCNICNKPETSVDSKGNVKWLCVDHNHSTNELRGLLCNNCNVGLGKLGDSISALESAIQYLKERGSYGE